MNKYIVSTKNRFIYQKTGQTKYRSNADLVNAKRKRDINLQKVSKWSNMIICTFVESKIKWQNIDGSKRKILTI